MKIPNDDLPLFPLRTVLFPQARLPLHIFEPRYREMIERCLREDLAFGVVLIKEGSEAGGPAIPHAVGTIARIVDVAHLADGRMNLVAAGVTRFKLVEPSTRHAYMSGQIQVWRDEDVNLRQVEPLARRAAEFFQQYVRAIQSVASPEKEEGEEKEGQPIRTPKDPTVLSYLIASSLQVSQSDKQSLLETPTVARRLRREVLFIDRELELLRRASEEGEHIQDQGTFSLN